MKRSKFSKSKALKQENTQLGKKVLSLKQERDSKRLGSEVREALLKKNEELRLLVRNLCFKIESMEEKGKIHEDLNHILENSKLLNPQALKPPYVKNNSSETPPLEKSAYVNSKRGHTPSPLQASTTDKKRTSNKSSTRKKENTSDVDSKRELKREYSESFKKFYDQLKKNKPSMGTGNVKKDLRSVYSNMNIKNRDDERKSLVQSHHQSSSTNQIQNVSISGRTSQTNHMINSRGEESKQLGGLSGRKTADGAKSSSPNPEKMFKKSIAVGGARQNKSNSESHHSSFNKGYESGSITGEESNMKKSNYIKKKQASHSPLRSKMMENYIRGVLIEPHQKKNQQNVIEFIRKHLLKDKNQKAGD